MLLLPESGGEGLPPMPDSSQKLAAQMIVSLPILAVLAIQFLAVPSHATTVMGVRTPNDIYLGADSKRTVTQLDRPGGTSPDDGPMCKITQVGEAFVAVRGFYEYSAYGSAKVNV